MSGGTYNLKPTQSDRCLRNFSWEFYLLLAVLPLIDDHFKTNWNKWHVIWQMALRLPKFERRINYNKKTQGIRNGFRFLHFYVMLRTYFQNHSKINWNKWHVIWQMAFRLSKFESKITDNKKMQVIRNGCTTLSSDSCIFMLSYVYIFNITSKQIEINDL